MTDPQPVVECSFITEFEDHIFVAMDAEVLLFLHDLVMSYVKEKDKGERAKVFYILRNSVGLPMIISFRLYHV